MKALIPTTIEFSADPALDLEVVTYDPTIPVDDAHTDAEIMVVWGNTRKQLADSVERLGNLKWLPALSAGTDVIEEAGFHKDVIITNGTRLQDLPVAEHALMLILAAVRRLDLMFEAQREGRWAREFSGVKPTSANRGSNEFPGLGILRGSRVTILGFGSIAKALAPFLTALGAEVTGIASTSGQRDGYPVYSLDKMFDLLPTTDILVNILPAHSSTEKIVSAEALHALPTHAWLVNVGRGATVDEDALITALLKGKIGGAALDVFAWEPLPSDSPLWNTPNTIITPHAAGGRPIGSTEFLNRNFKAYLDGAPLENLVRTND